MKKWLSLVFMLALTASAWGQAGTTVVTAHVVDGSGSVYVNCQWSVIFVGQNTTPGAGPYAPAPLLNGQQGNCDSSGNLGPVNLADNINTVTPTPSQWFFSICSATGYVPGNQYCKANIPITITGATQDISAALTAVLPSLPVSGGGGGTPNPPFGSLQGNNGGTFGGISSTVVNFSTGIITFNKPITLTPPVGVPPFTLSAATLIPNLNAALLNGQTFQNPGPIGSTPSTGNFTGITTGTLGATSTTTLSGGANIPTGAAVHIQNGGSLICDAGSTCPSGAAGNPGAPLGTVQGNNAGVFGGISTTSVNFSTGTVTLNNSVLVSGKLNNTCIFDGVVNATFSAAVTCAGTNGTVEIPIFSTGFPALTGNTTIAQGVFLKFDGPGTCINTAGFNLTINSVITAPSSQIFCSDGSGDPVTPGTVTLGLNNNSAPAEWFGAGGDWNGTTGTDNTVPLNACLAALTAGKCTIQGRTYKITAPLTISNPSVGIEGVATANPGASVFPSAPASSQIITTSASADIIDLAGSNPTTGNVGYNIFRNITLSRSVVPSGTSKGFSIVNSYGAILDNITVNDSVEGFYFKGAGSGGGGRIENCTVTWGFNGVTETSGSLYGFLVDSAGATPNPSLRIRNSTVANNLGHSAGGAFTTYGFAATGTYPADLHLVHPEAANTDYGIYINTTGTNFANLDLQVVDPILQVWTTGIFVQGLAAPYSSFTVTGGLSSNLVSGGAAPTIDIESSGNVKIMNHAVFYQSNSTAGLLAHNSTNVQSIGNTFYLGASGVPSISYSGTTGGQITNSTFSSVTATSLISLASTVNVAVGENSLEGTATNGILIDSASHGISGLESNTFGSAGGTITHPIADSGGNLQYINPAWYGADATGVSDSAASINGAVADCAGRTVLFSPGTYIASSAITWNTSCNLAGATTGRARPILRKNFNSGASGWIKITGSTNNVGLSNLELDGNSGSFTGFCVVDNANGTRHSFIGNYIHGCEGMSFNFTNATSLSEITLSDNYIVCGIGATSGNANGISVSQNVSHIIIHHNHIDCHLNTQTPAGAITMHSADAALTTAIGHITIDDNEINPPAGTGTSGTWAVEIGTFQGYGAADVVVKGNRVLLLANSGGGFSIQQVLGLVISGNNYDTNGFNPAYTALEMIGNFGTVVSNNHFVVENSTGAISNNCIVMEDNQATVSTNTCDGFGENGTLGVSAILIGGTHGSQAISAMSMSGGVISITVTTPPLNSWFVPNNGAYISGSTTTGYNGFCKFINTGYVRSSGTIQCKTDVITAGDAASCSSGCGAAILSFSQSNNVVSGNVVTFPVGALTTAGTPIVCIDIRSTGSNEIASNNLITGNTCVALNSTPVSGTEGVFLRGTGTIDSTMVQGNTFINLATGIQQNNGTNAQLLNNIFINNTTPVNINTGTVAASTWPLAFAKYNSCVAGMDGFTGVVTDNNTAVSFGATVTGGGTTSLVSAHVSMRCNGASAGPKWTITGN